jgi:arginyl-tRNA synthetase
MQTITEILKNIFSFEGYEAEITPATQPQFGHYQYNNAMKIAKQKSMPPREIAEMVIKHVNQNPIIEKLEIAGPGFINIWLKTSWIEQEINKIQNHSSLGFSSPENPKKIIVEFSSPNTAKEMHVGHLRSTIIGDCLARLFEFLGEKVLRLNHIGDWGTSFGMLIAYIKQYQSQILTQDNALIELPCLVQWYKNAKKIFDEDESFKKISQLEVVKLQAHDNKSIKIWQAICEISRKSYQEIYDILGIKLIERGESYYNNKLNGLIEDLNQAGVLEISDGAKCVFVNGFKNKEGNALPYMVQKSDGGFNYDTTDLAALRQRIEEEKAVKIIYVVDAGQSTHFQLLFQVAIKAGYLNPKTTNCIHVPFGLVLGVDGKKFKTRSGDTVRLMDLLDAAVDEARKIMLTRQISLSSQELDDLSKILGINAVKYADLACQRTQDYTFSFDRMLKFEGNTAAFLMYSYVRILGINRKIGVPTDQLKGSISLNHASEIALALHIIKFKDIIQNVSQDLCPHRLADYLYHLAEKFNAFFRDCRVEGDDNEMSRLLLCEVCKRTLKAGMEILGLKTVEKM